MTYQEAYDKLIKHAAEVEKWLKMCELEFQNECLSACLKMLSELKVLDTQVVIQTIVSSGYEGLFQLLKDKYQEI